MTTETKPTLAQRILAVMRELPYLQKTKAVRLGGRDVKTLSYEHLAEEVQPLLVKHGIVVLSSLKSQKVETLEAEKTNDRGEKYTTVTTVCTVEMAFTLLNADDPTESLDNLVFPGMGYDQSDKAMGKATTYAAKDFFRKTFVIPTGEEPEDDDLPRPSSSGMAQDATQRQEATKGQWSAKLTACVSVDAVSALWKLVPAVEMTTELKDEFRIRTEALRASEKVADEAFGKDDLAVAVEGGASNGRSREECLRVIRLETVGKVPQPRWTELVVKFCGRNEEWDRETPLADLRKLANAMLDEIVAQAKVKVGTTK